MGLGAAGDDPYSVRPADAEGTEGEDRRQEEGQYAQREGRVDQGFDHESVHESGVDTDADAVIDVAIRVHFSPVRNKQQTADVRLATGSDAAADFRWTGSRRHPGAVRWALSPTKG
ncbi:hypothetical protein AB0N50_37885 [Streptomyces pharetrae]|uniref:hypothetical protein n=1 Tax=Streptomyces pharetrae TaxID=291370 RepID=UPI00345F926F